MTADIPKVVSTGEWDVLGIKVRVHVLGDGRRVIEKDDFERLLQLLHGGDVTDAKTVVAAINQAIKGGMN